MLDILSKICLNKKRCCIYTDYDDMNKFCFGSVLAVNEKEIAIHLISPDGDDDGIVVMNTDDVIRVEVDGKYSEKMEKLCHGNVFNQYNLTDIADSILLSILSLANAQKQIVSVELLDSGYDDVIGFVESLEREVCVIKQIDEYGQEDGYSYISINDITQVSYSTQDEKRIMKLLKLNNG